MPPGSVAVPADRLRPLLDPGAVLSDRQQLRTYECDGLAHFRATPALVVFPRTAKQCRQPGLPHAGRVGLGRIG